MIHTKTLKKAKNENSRRHVLYRINSNIRNEKQLSTMKKTAAMSGRGSGGT